MVNQAATLTRDPPPPKSRSHSVARRKPPVMPPGGMKREDVVRAIARLTIVERARLEATETLKEIGVIRGCRLADDVGEAIAAVFYDVQLPATSGFDLETRDGARVRVRALHCTGKRPRVAIGILREPYDLLLALRLNADYAPREAIEVPREVVQEYQRHGRLNWTKRLTGDPRVRLIPGAAP